MRHTSWKRGGSMGHAKSRWNRTHSDRKTLAVRLVVQVATDGAYGETVRRQQVIVDDDN